MSANQMIVPAYLFITDCHQESLGNKRFALRLRFTPIEMYWLTAAIIMSSRLAVKSAAPKMGVVSS